MADFDLTLLAEQDLDEIIMYIAKENKNAALNLLNKFFEAFNLLADNPQIGHIRDDLTDKKVRFWSVKARYLVIYIDITPIKIIRVLSGYRDIASMIY
jgi:plasmid stabilization system protein ParE